jgi:predicted metal-dependent phosphoesterase TrpH
MYKIDLHSHSPLSPDGALSENNYRRILSSSGLDFVAITDHNQIAFAQDLQKKIGQQIIVGEEIDTGEGEIIGLFLASKIAPMLGAKKTVTEIKRQKALVYIPHPFEKVRKGIKPGMLAQIIDDVDIIETHNGRAYFNNQSKEADRWAQKYHKAAAASSDAHGPIGWGQTYSLIEHKPTIQNLVGELSAASYRHGYVGPVGVLYPKLNRLRHLFQNGR